jgi:hypothetical protein
MEEVKPNTYWLHKNGNLYSVLMITNQDSTREEYPVTVVYIGLNGKVWSRPLSDWHRSFTKLPDS